jgi:hypothetical protein
MVFCAGRSVEWHVFCLTAVDGIMDEKLVEATYEKNTSFGCDSRVDSTLSRHGLSAFME